VGPNYFPSTDVAATATSPSSRFARARAHGSHQTLSRRQRVTPRVSRRTVPVLVGLCCSFSHRHLHPSPSPPRTPAQPPRPTPLLLSAAAALSPEPEFAIRANRRERRAVPTEAAIPPGAVDPAEQRKRGGGFDEPREPAAAAAVVMLLASTVLRGRLRPLRRPRPPIMPSPLFLSPNPNPSPSPSAPMSTGGNVYVPPMRRLRSVIASTSGNLAPPPSVQPAWTPEWRADGRSLSPPSPPPPQTQRRTAALPPRPPPPQTQQPLRQQSAGYSRYAYDDFSEEESDREMDRTSVSSSKVNELLFSCCRTLHEIDKFEFSFP
jgi:ATP-dependent RNA helicase DHX36